MCVSSPKISTPTTAITAPTKAVEMDAGQNVAAARESDIQRRRRALSRASTMTGAMQGTEATGKTKLGA
ncbi:MAG: hypothetical protein IJR68_03800 [Fretibacterium sp.]|nr:hypothetical protein [Fretibacterium sp.]